MFDYTPFIGTSWGDPHFRTLDNKDFTFNGLGEYLLVQVPKQEKLFKLQARTTRPRKANGSLSKATIFSAFAAQGGDDANFHVEINQNKTAMSDSIHIYYLRSGSRNA